VNPRFLTAAAASALAWASFSAHAEEAKSDANPDPVLVFNRICYAQVPDLDAIRRMALKLAWKSMRKEELAEFKS